MISPNNVINDGEGVILYGKTIYKTTPEYGRTWYYIFYDPVRKDKLVAAFMSKLKKCYDELTDNKPVKNHEKLYEQYFMVNDTAKRGKKVSYNDAAIQEYINNDSYYWILIST